MSDDHCPTCGATVEVVTADEGTSHYRPVKDERLEAAEAERDRLQHDYDEMAEALQRESDDNFGQFQAAEARARKAEEALEAIHKEASGSTEADRLEMNGQLFRVLKIARSALATIRRELPDRPPPPPPPTPGLGRPETQGGRPNREEHG